MQPALDSVFGGSRCGGRAGFGGATDEGNSVVPRFALHSNLRQRGAGLRPGFSMPGLKSRSIRLARLKPPFRLWLSGGMAIRHLRRAPTTNQARGARLRLPKVDAERAGMASHNLAPRGVSLVRKEYVSLFDLRHNVRVPLDLMMMEAFATDHLTYLYQVRGRALEADYRVPWRHVTLKLVEHCASLH